jgi:hypothetical protein
MKTVKALRRMPRHDADALLARLAVLGRIDDQAGKYTVAAPEPAQG